jgi:predicted nicotinamide N-methyase
MRKHFLQRIGLKASSSCNLRNSTPPLLEHSTGSETSSPVLLLEGETLAIENGESRTLYEMDRSPVAIEEIYQLKKAKKTFRIRNKCEHDNVFGKQLASLELQEMRNVTHRTTGAVTWESSIAMAMFFCERPELLRGRAIELGSGVGLGGILANLGPALQIRGCDFANNAPLESLTMTDSCQEVLDQCVRNVQAARCFLPWILPTVYIAHLDWYDVAKSSDSSIDKYDTVIACDCAYRYEDNPALCQALTALLSKKDSSQIHMFGPYNRAALQGCVQYLTDDLGLEVYLEWIDVQRSRLKGKSTKKRLRPWNNTSEEQETFLKASSSSVKVLHVTAVRRRQLKKMSLDDLD